MAAWEGKATCQICQILNITTNWRNRGLNLLLKYGNILGEQKEKTNPAHVSRNVRCRSSLTSSSRKEKRQEDTHANQGKRLRSFRGQVS